MDESTSTSERTASLPGGRRLVVREATVGDRDGLEALYGDLDDDARYRRFFSLYRPGDRFFQDLLDAADRGGACLVALVSDPDAGTSRVVGEASYEPVPDGNAELAIVVDRGWRGWLGPYLLDALLEHAGAHGIPNLEADILVTNRPMLSLVRARRYATLPRREWTVLRAVVGAAEDLPSWPPRRSGPRVLLEGGGGRWAGEEAAKAAGFEVIACPGPVSCHARCPLLCGDRCPLVEGADAIVMTSTATEGGWDEVRAAHRSQHPEVPVIVENRRLRQGVDLVREVQDRLAPSDPRR